MDHEDERTFDDRYKVRTRRVGDLVTIDYEFSWAELPQRLLEGVEELIRSDANDPVAAIEERFGPVPSEDFVSTCAAPIVKDWLLFQSGFLEEIKDICIYEDLVNLDPAAFAAVLAGNAQACFEISQQLYIEGLVAVGSPFDGLHRPWHSEPVPEYDDDWIRSQMESLRQQLLVDDEWITIDGPNWSWWPTGAPIHFHAGPARLVDGDVMFRVTARCPLVSDISLEGADLFSLLSDWNQEASTFSLLYNAEANSVDAVCAFTAHEDNQPMWKIFSAAAVLIACLSRVRESMAEKFMGRAVDVPHPMSGLRGDFDDLTNFVGDVIIPRGDDEQFAASAFEIDFRQWPGCSLQVEDKTATMAQAELSLLHNLPAVITNRVGGPLGTSLVQVLGDERHPAYGRGLSIGLSIPDLPGLPSNAPLFLANTLNAMEFSEDTGFAFMGSWWAQPSDRVGDYDLFFRQFVPSAFYADGIADWAAWTVTLRNWWLGEVIDEIAGEEPALRQPSV